MHYKSIVYILTMTVGSMHTVTDMNMNSKACCIEITQKYSFNISTKYLLTLKVSLNSHHCMTSVRQ